MRTSKPINFTELGRLAGVSSPTAKKIMRYLELSYQVTLIPAFFRNPEKRLAKQPKVVFLDPGVRRGILRKSGVLDGLEWESAVIAEIYKQVRTGDLPVDLYHLRTLDGREVDLLIETEQGFIAVIEALPCTSFQNQRRSPLKNEWSERRNHKRLVPTPEYRC